MTANVHDGAALATHQPRNPFGVMDVPDPYDADVMAFAARATLDGADDDANAEPWASRDKVGRTAVDGGWSSRWNGGADPTIPGDSPEQWKRGPGTALVVEDRVYLLFHWDDCRRKGLIEARREGIDRLVGKYINLSNPQITRPWVGRIVDERRIDGRWTQGRLDFRR